MDNIIDNNNSQNDNPNNLDISYKNIFMDMDKNLLKIAQAQRESTETSLEHNPQDNMKFIEENFIPHIKVYICKNIGIQNKYDLELNKKNPNISKNIKNIIFSYISELDSKNLKVMKISNKYFVYNENELHVCTFNLKSEKFQLHLKYAMNHYDNCKLDYLEIKDVTEPSENDELKKQWINYLLNTKYYFALYGEKLLKLAIKQNNIYLIGMIFKKAIEYFKKNLKSNIYILSIICNNIPYLNDKYSEFILRYYNETSLIIDTLNQKIIYNNYNYLYSFCKQLKINRPFITSSFIFFRKYGEMIQFLILPIIITTCVSVTDFIDNIVITLDALISITYSDDKFSFILIYFFFIFFSVH